MTQDYLKPIERFTSFKLEEAIQRSERINNFLFWLGGIGLGILFLWCLITF